MPVPCPRCGAEIDQDAAICIHCGSAAELPPAPTVASVPGAEQAPALELAPPDGNAPALFVSSDLDADRHLEGIGGWLILVAIRLVLSPLLVLRALLATDLPILVGDRFREFRQTYPLLLGIVVFEAITNVIFILMLAWLLYLFFGRRRSFPAMMILFMVLQIVVVGADHLAVLAVHQHKTSSLLGLLQVLIYAAVWVPYFLVSRRVKVTFIR